MFPASTNDMGVDLGITLLFLIGSAAFVFVNLTIFKYFRPDNPYEDKNEIYECGERPIGDAWIQFNPRFYLVALIFLIFDVEIAFVFPVASVFKYYTEAGGAVGMVAFFELFFFMSVLLLGLVYVWRKGDLSWINPDEKLAGLSPSLRAAIERGQKEIQPS